MTDWYRDAIDRRWPEVRRLFNFPLLHGVRIADDADRDPSPVTWRDDRVVVSRAHLEALDPEPEDREAVVGALLKHEVGHYALFPRELSHHLRYLQRAEEVFGEERGYRYYARYADTCVELRLLKHRIGGEEILRYRHSAATAWAADESLSDPEREARRRIGRLLVALYQETFPDLPTVVSLPDREAAYLDRLREIDYFADGPEVHEGNLVRFGHALETALADLPGDALAGLATPEDRGKSPGERPFAGDAVDRIPEAELDSALSDALAEDEWVYDRLKGYLERRADFEDRYEAEQGGAAGLDRGAIERHDDEIPFYRRWAAEFPVYPTPTRQVEQETDLYRAGRKTFELGDPVDRLNPYASLGVLGVPGVSKVDRFDEGTVTTERTGVPDLLVGLDSSGSMPHPTEESHAVLAAFVLARAYHRNGASVGGYNFSGGVAFLPPSRSLEPFYALMCARWGGGTVLDREALVTFADRMGELDGIHVSDEEGHDEMVERELGEADAPVGAEAFDALDHVLVTDGNLANEDAVVEFVERVGDVARTFVFVTDPANYDRWADYSLPNTQVFTLGSEADLANLVVDVTRPVATDSGTDATRRPSDRP